MPAFGSLESVDPDHRLGPVAPSLPLSSVERLWICIRRGEVPSANVSSRFLVLSGDFVLAICGGLWPEEISVGGALACLTVTIDEEEERFEPDGGLSMAKLKGAGSAGIVL